MGENILQYDCLLPEQKYPKWYRPLSLKVLARYLYRYCDYGYTANKSLKSLNASQMGMQDFPPTESRAETLRKQKD